MSNRRAALHNSLSRITGSTKNVYYQPPANVHMKYPCIEYHDAPWDTKFANDMPYAITRHYQLTVIDSKPDNPWIMTIAQTFPMCQHNRHYTADGLNHDVFDIYY